jgi:putative membrane protein
MKSFRTTLKIFLCLTMVLSFKTVVLADYDYRGYGGWGMGPGMMGWGAASWIGPIFMVIFWILIIILIVLLIRRLLSPGPAASHQDLIREDSALDILKKRYARGEIDKQEFEAKKRDLG